MLHVILSLGDGFWVMRSASSADLSYITVVAASIAIAETLAGSLHDAADVGVNLERAANKLRLFQCQRSGTRADEHSVVHFQILSPFENRIRPTCLRMRA
jgi:hypothetical protein